MPITHFQRKPHPYHFSIEGLFAEIRAKMSQYPVELVVCPHFSQGLFPRIKNTWFASRNQGKVNHITGDVHYLALGLRKQKTILTIHDCAFMRHPKALARFILKWFWLRLPVWRSRYVTVISQATKEEVLQHVPNCPSDKIIIIPDAVSEAYQPFPREFNAVKPRILLVGTKKNKNLERSITALENIPCEIHLIGEKKEEINQLLHQCDIDHQWSTRLSNQAMLAAYQNADLLLFASTLEGFGMPIIEAQAVGRPVVTSDLSSMPEVAGSGACLVNPYDPDCIRAGVLRLIEDREYREYLVQKGFENVQRFRAEEVARQYEALYERVLRGGETAKSKSQ